MKRSRFLGLWTLSAACALLAPASARAELIVNGGFELGLTGWTTAEQAGSEGAFVVQTGTASPVNGLDVPAPPEGDQAAMSDAAGPGSRVLYQDFLVPIAGPGLFDLRFQLSVNNLAGDFFVPATPTLDFATPALNQQARVDLLGAAADPFSVAAADVIANLFQTSPGAAFTGAYFTVATQVDLAPFRGQTIRLRFAQVDNVNLFTLGVDAVSLQAVPEPSSLTLLAVAVAAALGARRIRRGIVG